MEELIKAGFVKVDKYELEFYRFEWKGGKALDYFTIDGTVLFTNKYIECYRLANGATEEQVLNILKALQC